MTQYTRDALPGARLLPCNCTCYLAAPKSCCHCNCFTLMFDTPALRIQGIETSKPCSPFSTDGLM